MPVLGFVLTHPRPEQLRERQPGVPRFAALGAPHGPHLPAVFHTDDPRADEALLDALRGLDGVDAVDLAFADFSDLEPVRP